MAEKATYIAVDLGAESGRVMLGRFGWKANQPSVRQQIAAAFSGDIGATSYLYQLENLF